MPKGVKPAGTVPFVNDLTRLNCPSYTSTLLLATSAAYRKLPEVLLVIAKPVYEAPVDELFTAIMASFGLDCGAHPLMVPSRVAKRKNPVHPPTCNPDDPLKTIPVGDPGPAPEADGITTPRV